MSYNDERFTRSNNIYGIVRLENRYEHAAALAHGVSMMPDGFVCSVCALCKGEGVRKFERCSLCAGTGLTQASDVGSFPAFDSQRHQVLVAASRSMLLNFVVEVL